MEKETLSDLKNMLLDQAINLLTKGEVDKAVEKIGSLKEALSTVVPFLIVWVNDLLGIIAEELGEDRVFEYWRKFANERFNENYSLSPIERLKFYVTAHNALGSNIKNVEEKKDRYVLTLDPCGSMGAARRRNMINLEKGVTKKAYDFLWDKKGVPYYCIHCVIGGEVVPKEKVGKAFWIQDWPETPEGVCRYNFLK